MPQTSQLVGVRGIAQVRLRVWTIHLSPTCLHAGTTARQSERIDEAAPTDSVFLKSPRKSTTSLRKLGRARALPSAAT